MTRVFGVLLMTVGGLVLLTWAITPLRFIWPWLRGLPLPIKVGAGAAVFGVIVLLASLIQERFEERDADRALREE